MKEKETSKTNTNKNSESSYLDDISIHSWIRSYGITNEKGDPIEFKSHPFLFDIYTDLADNLCVMKAAQVGASTMEIIKNIYDARRQKMDIIYCVDTETESLSKRGFVKYNELTLEDELLTLGLDGITRWSKVKEVFINDVETNIYRFKNRNFDAVTTENHRWIVKGKGKKHFIKESRNLIDGYTYIPKTVEEIEEQDKIYGDEYVKLLSWIFSEGYYCKQKGKNDYSIIITQSIKNSDYCDDIRKCLRNNHIQWKEYFNNTNSCFNFRFAFELGKVIKETYPDKLPTAEFASKLTKEQCQIFIETFVKADGWIDKNGTLAITQKDKRCVNVLNMIAVLGGYAPSVVKPSVNGCYTLRMTRYKTIHSAELKPTIQKEKIRIWCPRTEQGTFYARRNGRCYWTGNTLPTDKDVQVFVGGKVNRIIANNQILQKYTTDKDTIEQKQICNSMVYFRGTWTQKAAIMVTADRLVHDEIDSSKQNVVKEYQARLQHSKFRQIHVFSHPSAPGVGVDEFWQLSDQKHWFVTCPHCLKEHYMEWPTSIDMDRRLYVCKYCKGELSENDRKKGRWVQKFKEAKFSGYWIPLFICPWVAAGELIDKYNDPKITEEFFYNKVLGLPYAGSGNVVSQDTIFKNLTNKINEQKGRIVIGVDTGIDIRFVIGNEEGIFYYGQCKDYSELERYLKRWERSVMVIDQGGDIIGPRKLREAYPGRVFLCFYQKDKANKELIQWGKDKEAGKVRADRNRLIQLVVDEFTDNRITLFGTENDWYDYYLHWSHIYRVKEENNLGIMEYKWMRSDRDDWAHATCYWRIGMDRFGQKGEILGGFNLKPNSFEIAKDMTAPNPHPSEIWDMNNHSEDEWR